MVEVAILVGVAVNAAVGAAMLAVLVRHMRQASEVLGLAKSWFGMAAEHHADARTLLNVAEKSAVTAADAVTTIPERVAAQVATEVKKAQDSGVHLKGK